MSSGCMPENSRTCQFTSAWPRIAKHHKHARDDKHETDLFELLVVGAEEPAAQRDGAENGHLVVALAGAVIVEARQGRATDPRGCG
jgi:hypothetical protein